MGAWTPGSRWPRSSSDSEAGAPAFDVRVLTTGPHRGLLDRALDDFGIAPDLDLDLMRPDQGLADLHERVGGSLPPEVGGGISLKAVMQMEMLRTKSPEMVRSGSSR